jgi:hypothetical protein
LVKTSSIVNKLIILFVLVLALLGLITLGWFAYKEEAEQKSQAIPVIQASESPIKIKPINEETAESQDKKIYNIIDSAEKPSTSTKPIPTIQKSDNTKSIEKYLAEKENIEKQPKTESAQTTEPLIISNRPPVVQNTIEPTESQELANLEVQKKEVEVQVNNIKKSLNSISSNSKNNESYKVSLEKPNVAEPQKEAYSYKEIASKHKENNKNNYKLQKPNSIAEEGKIAPANVALKDVPKKPEVKKEEEKTSQVKVVSKPQPKTGVFVQLGSFRSADLAHLSWNKIKSRVPEIIGKKQDLIEKADLGNKGVFYRLKTGPFASRKEGLDFCLKLIRLNQSCIVLK